MTNPISSPGREEDPLVHLPATPTLPLRTARLEMRAFRATDVGDLHRIHSDPVAVRFVPYRPRNLAGTANVLERKVLNTVLSRDGDLLELAVTLGGNGPLVGDVLLILRSVEHQTVEVGYIFAPQHGGRGYATEAVRALLALAFG